MVHPVFRSLDLRSNLLLNKVKKCRRRFKVLKALKISIVVLWDVTPFSLVPAFLKMKAIDTFLRNIGNQIEDTTATQTRRLQSTDLEAELQTS
jgi:hypothetical protein